MGYQLLNSPYTITDPFLRIRPISKYHIVNYLELESILRSTLIVNKKSLIIKMEEAK